MMYSRAERVFILEHYFASKSLAAVREAFSNAYSDKEVPNKTRLPSNETGMEYSPLHDRLATRSKKESNISM
jgi:hypothetical protein